MKHFTVDELPGIRFPWYGRPVLEDWVKLKQYVYQRDGGKCRYCGEPVRYEDSHCHHVLPLSEFGTNHPTNLKTSCIKCHKDRHPFMKDGTDKVRELT